MRHLANQRSAWIVVLVNAVTEAHQAEARFLVLRLLDSRLHVLRRADFLQHLQNGFVRTTVGRSPQCSDARRNGGIRIRAGGADETDGGCRRILLMVRMQNQQQIQCLRRNRIQLKRLRRNFAQHGQEAGCVVEVVTRVALREADRMTVRSSRDRWNLRDQTDRSQAALFRIFEIQLVVIDAGQRAEHGDQHRHRVTVVHEALDHRICGLMHHRVMRDFAFECRKFRCGRQFAVHQQVSDFKEVRMFGELFDWITAIKQNTFVAIDVRDRGLARCRGGEARVVREHAGFFRQFRDINAVCANGWRENWQLDGLVAGGEGCGLIGHVDS